MALGQGPSTLRNGWHILEIPLKGLTLNLVMNANAYIVINIVVSSYMESLS